MLLLKIFVYIPTVSKKTKANLNKVYWVTSCPRHIKRHGFKESKSILMEYSQDDEKSKKIQDEVING